MSTSAKTLTPEQIAALQKAQSIAQQQALDKYLSGRATQYGTTPKGGTAWTAGQTLANPFAGLTDLGKKTQFVSQGGGEEAPQEQEVAKTVSDVLGEKFGAQLGHKSTFARAYKKDEKGNPTEVNIDSLTPEELNSGNVVLFMGGATGGKERERMAQAYIPKGDKLIPVGDPTYYKGEHPDAANVANALQIGSILSLPFGGSLFGASNLLTQGLGSFLPEAAAKVAGSALASGIAQGTMSKLTGGSFGKGFGTGAIAGGVGAGLDQFAGDTFKNLGEFAKPAKSLVTSGVTSLLTGQKFDPTTAVQNAAINYGLGKAGEAAGIDSKQQAALMRGLNFAMPLIAARRKPGGP